MDEHEPDVHVFNLEDIQAASTMTAVEIADGRFRQALRNLGTYYAHVTSLEVWQDEKKYHTYHARLEWTPAA
jgi:hypothetical protein